MSTVYELIRDHDELDRMLDESGGELTEEIVAAMGDLNLRERSKVDHLGKFIRETEAREKAVKAERDALAVRATALGNKVKSLKRLAQMYLDERGLTKVEGEVFVIGKQKNGGLPPLVLNEDIAGKLAAGVPVKDVVPVEWLKVRTEFSVDNEKLREALAEGDESAQAVAAIGEPGFHVRVR